MNSADWHLRYERERRGDLVRAAQRHDLAARVLGARGRGLDGLEGPGSHSDGGLLSPTPRPLPH